MGSLIFHQTTLPNFTFGQSLNTLYPIVVGVVLLFTRNSTYNLKCRVDFFSMITPTIQDALALITTDEKRRASISSTRKTQTHLHLRTQ